MGIPEPDIKERFTFDAIGTSWSIETTGPIAEPLRQSILGRAEAFDLVWSRFRKDSLVSEIARAQYGGRFAFPDEGVRLFDLYDQLHAATDGAVDPLVGRDLEMLGYDRDYSLTALPEAARASYHRPGWATDVSRDSSVLTTHGPLVIDVGAAGKGLLVDLIVDMLQNSGILDYVVDASGDLSHAGSDTLSVGLEDPRKTGHVIGIAHLNGRALCASATNRRRWGDDLPHILDARSGRPVRDVVATWVVADGAMAADGLATALFFSSPQALAHLGSFEFVRIFEYGRADCSPGFHGEIFV